MTNEWFKTLLTSLTFFFSGRVRWFEKWFEKWKPHAYHMSVDASFLCGVSCVAVVVVSPVNGWCGEFDVDLLPYIRCWLWCCARACVFVRVLCVCDSCCVHVYRTIICMLFPRVGVSLPSHRCGETKRVFYFFRRFYFILFYFFVVFISSAFDRWWYVTYVLHTMPVYTADTKTNQKN